MVTQENLLLWDLLDKTQYQMSSNFALLKLVERENERLQQQLFRTTQRPNKKTTGAYARHMTSNECLEALVRGVWESNLKNIFKSTEWKEHKKSCAATEKRLVAEEKERERERERGQKDTECHEKAQEKDTEHHEKAQEKDAE